jgi:hypothetical protein
MKFNTIDKTFATHPVFAGFSHIFEQGKYCITDDGGRVYAGQAFNSDPRWQYSKAEQSPAWEGPQAFFDYAKANNGGKICMNFTAQTSTKRGNGLNFEQVSVGDIIVVDWENDNKINHTMVVTGGTTSDNGNNAGQLLI